MKLNTGLLLSRPGESAYARYRQFLIANNGLSFQELTKELKRKFLITKPNIFNPTEPYFLAKCATKLEHEYIEVNYRNKTKSYSDLIGKYRPKRCCNKCASVGYHCDLFDMPWIRKCPIHNENLTERCNRCNQLWPTASELRLNKCPTCGVKISIQDLLKTTTNNTDNGYQLIINAQLLVSQGYRLFSSKFYLYKKEHRREYVQDLIHQTSAFYLSVVEKSLNKKKLLCHLIKTLNIEKKTYKVTRIPAPQSITNSKELLTLKTKIIKKTITKFESVFNKKGHLIGTCETNSFPQRVCLPCATLNAWKKLINYYDEGYNAYCWSNHLATLYSVPTPSSPIIYSMIYIGDFYLNEEYIGLPLKLSGKIYEHDLWTTAMHLYQYISYIMDKAKDFPIFRTEFIKNCRPIMLHHNSTFSPYVMNLTGDKLDVYYLKNILTTKLYESEKIDQLLHYSLDEL
ncbi:MAG: hypothetical protein COA63_006650 [Methylophaga sp.]|nr:hypothetical protein [Methylophaga sp.]